MAIVDLGSDNQQKILGQILHNVTLTENSDACNPSNTGNAIHWDSYFEKLKMIGVKKAISKK